MLSYLLLLFQQSQFLYHTLSWRTSVCICMQNVTKLNQNTIRRGTRKYMETEIRETTSKVVYTAWSFISKQATLLVIMWREMVSWCLSSGYSNQIIIYGHKCKCGCTVDTFVSCGLARRESDVYQQQFESRPAVWHMHILHQAPWTETVWQ